jgi:hypothetical protein
MTMEVTWGGRREARLDLDEIQIELGWWRWSLLLALWPGREGKTYGERRRPTTKA